MASKHTTNRSERDITQKFNLVEFNRIFEQNLNLENKKENNSKELPTECLEKSQNYTFIIIICIIIIIGVSLLLFNNFIRIET